MTYQEMLDTLPEVKVNFEGTIFNAITRGRKTPFALVICYLDTNKGREYAEELPFSWKTVLRSINSGQPLKA